MVVIFGQISDVHAAAVMWALQRAGVRCEIIDLYHLVAGGMISLSDNMDVLTWRRTDTEPVKSIVLSEVDCVWLRRIGFGSFDVSRLHEEDVSAAKVELDRLAKSLYGLVGLRAKFAVNDVRSKFHSELKPVQLWLASKVGFAVPRTLIANCPIAVGDFVSSNQKAIFKPFEQGSWVRDGKLNLHRTRLIDREILKLAASIELSPGIYQSYIDKAYEIRVTVMGDEIVAAKLDTQAVESARVDWKDDLFDEVEIAPYRLPPDVERKIFRFMKEMDLDFGCIDLIATPDGEYIFLEINPQGQFLWIEARNPEIKLLDKFARYLCRKANISADFPDLSFHGYLNSADHQICKGYWKPARYLEPAL